MVHNRLYEDWGELAAVFRRNAASYLFESRRVGPYRPVTMFTLIGTHLLVPHPWLHHAVSWVLHAATSLLLFLVLRSSAGVPPRESRELSDIVAAGLAALFFLHPLHVESYVWINGRSDLLAGFWLALLALSLNRISDSSQRDPKPLLAVGLVAFLGTSSKLPFAIAAAAVWLAWTIRSRAPRRWKAGGAILAGIGVHLGLRAHFAPFQNQVGANHGVFTDPETWAVLPRLVGKGADAVLAFRAESMQSLSWALFGPWEATEWLGLAITALGVAFLAYRRDWAGVTYVAGAIATLAPVIVVSRAFWLGFDRYLYMPMILAVMALPPYLVLATTRAPRLRVILGICGLALLTLATIRTHEASKAYANQGAYDLALIRDHDDDPTIHYYFALRAARRRNQRAVREHLSSMPSPPWPKPIIVRTYELATKAQSTAEAREAVDALVATIRDGSSCELAREQLETWLQTAPDAPTRAHISGRLDALSCKR